MNDLAITCADILEWAESYDGPKYHAAFCDAPYHLTEINKRFSAPDAAPAQYGTDGAFQRAARGFMGKDWDGGDIAFRPETWAAIAQHIHPGGFIVSFAGSRGWHRMAVAMEDAGLLIHPTIFLWSYGSGFPKATRIDSQIANDAFRAWLNAHPAERERLRTLAEAYRETRRQHKTDPARKADRDAALNALRAAERELKLASGIYTYAGGKKHAPKFDAVGHGYREKDNGFNSKERTHYDLLEPVAEEAQRWAGHRYGGQSVKPAVEPIIVAQVPYRGRPVDNISATGAGAFNIDGARIAGTPDKPFGRINRRRIQEPGGYHDDLIEAPDPNPAGRWPANFVLQHHPDCTPIGTRRVRGTKGEADYTPGAPASIPAGCAGGTIKTGRHYADADGRETVAAYDCHPQCAVRKLGEQSGERPTGPGGTTRANDNSPVYTGPASSSDRATVGYDDTGTAARFFYCGDWMLERLEQADPVGYFAKASSAEREAGLDDMQVRLMRELYGDEDEGETFDDTTVDDGRATPIDNPYLRGETTRRNTHPTIKSLSLCRWLATLLLPPDAYAPRRLLVPFAGVASECIGAYLAGWEVVHGVELEADHVRIAEARIAYWRQLRHRFINPDTPIRLKAAPKVPAGQLELF